MDTFTSWGGGDNAYFCVRTLPHETVHNTPCDMYGVAKINEFVRKIYPNGTPETVHCTQRDCYVAFFPRRCKARHAAATARRRRREKWNVTRTSVVLYSTADLIRQTGFRDDESILVMRYD